MDGWEYRLVKPDLGDPNLDAKIYKVLPQEFDQDFDYTMFVDANTLLSGRIDEFIDKYLADNEFVMFKHPERSDIYAEGVAIVESERHSPAKILDQISAYSRLGLPAESGLAEASFIWRSTRNATLTELMIRWWQHICTYTKRDQLSLGFIMWEQKFRPRALPKDVGTSRDNSYFFKLPHAKLPSEVKTGVSGRAGLGPVKSADIWFLYAARHAKTGSTVLRGQQLSDLYREFSGDDRGVFYSTFDDLSEKIVYLTKGYLMQRGVDGVARLKARGNIVLADYVDAKANPEVAKIVDVLIASSIKGFIDLRGRFPATRSHHVTHHVDLRINDVSVPKSYVAGYFGELVNTIIDPTLRNIVKFVSVDTSTVDLAWLKALHQFSFHYAARKKRGIDDHKPFLKGFTAAHCGANMLIQSGAGDAKYYLGEDYPYLVSDNAAIGEVIEKLKFAEESFGGPEWQFGLEVMAEVRERSSRRKVASELLALIRTL